MRPAVTDRVVRPNRGAVTTAGNRAPPCRSTPTPGGARLLPDRHHAQTVRRLCKGLQKNTCPGSAAWVYPAPSTRSRTGRFPNRWRSPPPGGGRTDRRRGAI